jgi:histidinol-phosphate aminotransferase
LIRLAGNENPHGPGPAARAAIQSAIAASWKYPMTEEMTLKAQIAEREGLTPRHVMIGDGSSEILHIAAVLFGLDRGELVTAAPTFTLAADHAKAIGAGVKAIPLDAELRYDLKAMRAAISANTRLIYVCNPNNPTGTTVPGAELREFIAGVPAGAAVLVDEAYLELAADMAENSAVARVKAGDTVIVARTFSKLHGLAGLRIGYALARPDIIEKMVRLKLPVANSLGLVAATASYNDFEFQAFSRRSIAEAVAITVAALQDLKRQYAPTKANFVFFETGEPARQFLNAMRAKGFALGRPFQPYDTWCRVSMGKVEEMRAFAGALRQHSAAPA